MPDTPAYLIIHSIPDPVKMKKLQTYIDKATPILEAHGGKLVGRYKMVEQLIGKGGPVTTAALEFPSAEAIKQALDSAEFKALAALRAEVFHRLDLILAEAL